MNYVCFDQVKAVYQRLKRRWGWAVDLTFAEAFAIGALAKVAATLVTYPLIRSKIIMQGGQVQSLTCYPRVE